MNAPDVIEAAPDWSTAADLTCPLCGYNLRGLTDPRCPECGFAFRWGELLDADRDRHPYLFEHGSGHNLRTFWTTYWRTCRPRRFWREVTPANPVRLRRLIAYWAVASLLLAGVFVVSVPAEALHLAHRNQAQLSRFTPVPGRPGIFTDRRSYGFVTKPEIDFYWPAPLSWTFAGQLWTAHWQQFNAAWMDMIAVVMAWPWLTVVALMVFQASMRRAKVNAAHVLRAVIYGCDFGLLMLLILGALFLGVDGSPWPRRWGSNEVASLMFLMALVCAAVTLYRLSFAYSRYLRFHLPLATVLASQVLVCLFVVAVLLQLSNSF